MYHTNYKQMIEEFDKEFCYNLDEPQKDFLINSLMATQLRQFLKSSYIKSLNNEIEYLESKKKEGTQVGIPCPDGMIGCCVYHCETRLTLEDKAYNLALQDLISHLLLEKSRINEEE